MSFLRQILLALIISSGVTVAWSGGIGLPPTFTIGTTIVSLGQTISTIMGLTFNVYTGNPSGAAPYEFSLNDTAPPGPHDAASSIHLTAKDGDLGVIAIDTFSNQPILGFRRANGTNAAKTTLINNDVMAQIGVIGTDVNGYSQYNAMLVAAASENWSATAHGNRWGFITTAKTTNQRYDELQIGDGVVVSATTYETLPTAAPGLGNLRVSGNLAVTTAAMESNVNVSVNANAATPPTAISNTLAHFTALDNTFGAVLFDSFSNTTTTGAQFVFRKAKGTNAAPATLTANTVLGYISFQGYDGTAYSTSGKGLISVVASETWGTTARGTSMAFATTANATDTTSTKMRIHGSGGIGVGSVNAGTDLGDGNVLANGLKLTAAGLLSVSSGTNQRAGNAILVGGTVTVSNTTVTANTVVILTRKTSGGTIGTAITYTVSAGASFTITSDNILDTSTFSYMLVEVP